MPLPTSKDELLKNLYDAYEKLDSEFTAVSPDTEREPGIAGEISCCDIVAYQIGWANLLLGWDESELKGKLPAMPASGFKWNQLGELAKSFYAKESTKTLQQLRVEFRLVHKRLVIWIESLSEQELFEIHQRQWTGEKWTMVKWIQVNTIAPYRSARTKVRRWKKEHGI